MSNENLVPLLKDLLEEVKSINRNLIMVLNKKDQDHDHDLNQSDQSDQIRSDLISKNCSNLETFIAHCEKYEIEIANLDLKSKERAIAYYLDNQRKITSKKGYIITMLKNCERISQQPKITHSSPPDEDRSHDILGIPPEIVEAKSSLLDQFTYDQIFTYLTAAEKRMFSSFEKVSQSAMLRNIIIAKGINAGII